MFIVCDNFSRRSHRSKEHYLAGLKILRHYQHDSRETVIDLKTRRRLAMRAETEKIEYQNMIEEYVKPLFDFYVSIENHFGRQTRFTVRNRSLALSARKKMQEEAKEVPTLPCMHGKEGPPPIDWDEFVARHR